MSHTATLDPSSLQLLISEEAALSDFDDRATCAVGRYLLVAVVAIWAGGFAWGFLPSLALLTVLAFGCAVVGLARPVAGLFGISLLCTTEMVGKHLLFTGGLLRFHTLEYWLLAVMLLGYPLLVRLHDAQTRLFQLFLVVLSLGLVLSPDRGSGMLHLLYAVTYFGVVVYLLRSPPDAAQWKWLGLVNGAAGALGGLVCLAQRASLPDMNANAWSYFPLTSLLLICLAYPFAEGDRRTRLLLWLLASMNVAWIFLIGSRGALFTAIICCFFLLKTSKGSMSRLLALALGALVCWFLASEFTELRSRTLDRYSVLLDSSQSAVARTSGRSALVLDGWQLFLQHPLGVGTGGFAVARTTLRDDTVMGHAARPAHAGWIKTLAENGVPGIVLHAAYVLSFVIIGWRYRRAGMFDFGWLVSAVLVCSFISTEFQQKGLWFLAGAVTTLFEEVKLER